MQKIHFSDRELEQMLLTLSEVTEKLHLIEDDKTKELITDLMQHFDVIHREGLSRLWKALQREQPQLCTELAKDYAVQHILALYDLVPFEGVKKPVDLPPVIPVDEVRILNSGN
jgi:hypothetical protein